MYVEPSTFVECIPRHMSFAAPGLLFLEKIDTALSELASLGFGHQRETSTISASPALIRHGEHGVSEILSNSKSNQHESALRQAPTVAPTVAAHRQAPEFWVN